MNHASETSEPICQKGDRPDSDTTTRSRRKRTDADNVTVNSEGVEVKGARRGRELTESEKMIRERFPEWSRISRREIRKMRREWGR
jgi:hypothetical protein